jgi:riboflavin kinase / FMN adenylyltransferase
MRHVMSLEEANLIQPSVVTIGAFDGVHKGHQLLIAEAIEYATANQLIPVVLTFFPHPEIVLRGPQPGFYLTLPEYKAGLLGKLGVKLVVTHPFNDEIRHMRASVFVDRLLQHLNMKALWVGADFAMGYQREGNIDFLRSKSQELDFSLRVVDLMDAGGERVSSSRIRSALAEGSVEDASRLLNRLYALPGTVVEGAKRGRTIGIPTANLAVPEEQAVPARGVYAAWAIVDGDRHQSVVNIGMRPTFDGSGVQVIEAHLLDFSGDLYGKAMSLEFAARLRDEMKFTGVEALIAQIQKDIVAAKALFRHDTGKFEAVD